jgi:hypothetical protein
MVVSLAGLSQAQEPDALMETDGIEAGPADDLAWMIHDAINAMGIADDEWEAADPADMIPASEVARLEGRNRYASAITGPIVPIEDDDLTDFLSSFGAAPAPLGDRLIQTRIEHQKFGAMVMDDL